MLSWLSCQLIKYDRCRDYECSCNWQGVSQEGDECVQCTSAVRQHGIKPLQIGVSQRFVTDGRGKAHFLSACSSTWHVVPSHTGTSRPYGKASGSGGGSRRAQSTPSTWPTTSACCGSSRPSARAPPNSPSWSTSCCTPTRPGLSSVRSPRSPSLESRHHMRSLLPVYRL